MSSLAAAHVESGARASILATLRPESSKNCPLALKRGSGALTEHPCSKQKLALRKRPARFLSRQSSSSRPARCAQRSPCRFTAVIEPQTGPSAGRAECRRRPGQVGSENPSCRGPPALPVKLPVHHRPSGEGRCGECKGGFGSGDKFIFAGGRGPRLNLLPSLGEGARGTRADEG
jgi:hypothetical protein